MRRILGIAIVLGAAVMASSLALAATGQGTSRHERHAQTIRLTASTFDSRDLDLGPTGPTLGDYFVVTEDLFRHGKKVGTDDGTCTITRIEPKKGTPKRGALTCATTFVLPQGQIAVYGTRSAELASQKPPNFVLAITGGTGVYRRARGTVHIVDLNESDSRVTLRLDR